MSIAWDDKDPDDVLDYQINWVGSLPRNDTISTSTFTIPTTDGALTIDSDTNDDYRTTVWLSGGTEGYTYSVQNRIVTVGGRTLDQTVSLTVTTR